MNLLDGFIMWEEKMRKVVVLLCILCLFFCVAGTVRAQPASDPAISIGEVSPPVPANIGDDWMIGFEFIPTVDMIVTDLGFFSPSAQQPQSHIVSIFNSTGNCLTSATVMGDGSDDFVYAHLSPSDSLPLISGNLYYILGENQFVDYILEVLAGGWSASGIHSLQDRNLWGDYTAWDDINTGDLGTDYYEFVCGPNFKYTAIPIPGAIWLLGSGLIGLVGLKRRRG